MVRGCAKKRGSAGEQDSEKKRARAHRLLNGCFEGGVSGVSHLR
jgi:hypothetical protein